MAGKAFACLALLLLLAVSAQAQLGQYCIADDINGFTADDFFDAPADVRLPLSSLSTAPLASTDESVPFIALIHTIGQPCYLHR